MSQTPTICRMVQYRLSEADVDLIEHRRRGTGVEGNHVIAGAVCAAVVVQVWDVEPAPLCNLKVLLDGQDTYWATSRAEGTDPGTWAWPARV